MKFKKVTLKNEEGNDRKRPEERVYVVENLPVNEVAETSSVLAVEGYTLERINLLIANTQKDLTQIQERLEWALKVKEGIEESLANEEKKKDN